MFSAAGQTVVQGVVLLRGQAGRDLAYDLYNLARNGIAIRTGRTFEQISDCRADLRLGAVRPAKSPI
jgi:hypothetical protein